MSLKAVPVWAPSWPASQALKGPLTYRLGLLATVRLSRLYHSIALIVVALGTESDTCSRWCQDSVLTMLHARSRVLAQCLTGTFGSDMRASGSTPNARGALRMSRILSPACLRSYIAHAYMMQGYSGALFYLYTDLIHLHPPA